MPINKLKNWNCDGDHCRDPRGETRVYPTGGGSNLILCRDCFAYENAFNAMRCNETRNPDAWPMINWTTAKRYPETPEIGDQPYGT